MKESRLGIGPEENPAYGHTDRREEMLDLCYNRLKELIPECTSEVNLLKCIEILEKRGKVVAGRKRRYAVGDRRYSRPSCRLTLTF